MQNSMHLCYFSITEGLYFKIFSQNNYYSVNESLNEHKTG